MEVVLVVILEVLVIVAPVDNSVFGVVTHVFWSKVVADDAVVSLKLHHRPKIRRKKK